TAGCVVQRKRQTDELESCDWRLGRRKQHRTRMRQIADLVVLNDGGVVVEDERAVQAIGIGEDDGHGNDRRAPSDAARRRGPVCFLSPSLHSAVSSYSHIHIHETSASI